MINYSYQLTLVARKRLNKLPPQIQQRIIKKIKYFCQVNPLLYAEKLSDFRIGDYRFCIGNYRVIFDLRQTTITILDVGHRKGIYR